MTPLVGIIMGSESDLPVMEEAEAVLKEFGVPYELDIISAHRAPDRAAEYAKTARERGLKVIICAAGMAAHLGGVIASHTPLPVVGVPIASGPLSGVDSLYSTVQMPRGLPVATVGIGAARNAAILAVQILAASDSGLAVKLDEFRRKLTESMLAQSEKNRRQG